MRAPPSFTHFALNASCHMIARQQLGRAAGGLVALCVAPAFFFAVCGLALVVVGNIVEHEALAIGVSQHASLTAHALGDENSLHARRPHHPRRMELDELHVNQLRTCIVGQRMPVARVLPAVARDVKCAPDAAGREDHCA